MLSFNIFVSSIFGFIYFEDVAYSYSEDALRSETLIVFIYYLKSQYEVFQGRLLNHPIRSISSQELCSRPNLVHSNIILHMSAI